MIEPILGDAAERDLYLLTRYVARKYGAWYATHVLQAIWKQLEFLCTFPKLGDDCSDIFPKLRRSTAFKYVIYFAPSIHGILVHRIVHGSRHHRRIVMRYFGT